MRNFLIKSAIFLTLCGLLDFGLGKIFGYLTVHATGGYTKRDNFISDEVDANILIFGSSRAAHHYVPSILSDSLDMSCYNCGLDGNGIIYGYGKLKTITARYYPKIVLPPEPPSSTMTQTSSLHSICLQTTIANTWLPCGRIINIRESIHYSGT